jgi:hypothetical protein
MEEFELSQLLNDLTNQDEVLVGAVVELKSEIDRVEEKVDKIKLIPGPKGEKGKDGDMGEEGPMGPRGLPGSQGPQGLPGIQGPKGEKGNDGNIGSIGPVGPMGPQGPSGEKGKDGAQGKIGKTGPMGQQGSKGDIGRMGATGLTGPKGEDGKPGRDGSPDTGEEIVNKINDLLLEPNYQIDASHIKNLPKYRETIPINFGGGSSSSATAQKRDNLSSQCDDSNTIFTLTNNYKPGTMQLWSSQFPIVFDPDTDFTETSANTITLVDIVPATGQTLVAIYEILQ